MSEYYQLLIDLAQDYIDFLEADDWLTGPPWEEPEPTET